MKNGYYHISEVASVEIAYFENEPEGAFCLDWIGPFKTLAECKEDAIEFQKTFIHNCRVSIAETRKLRKKDVEWRKE